MCRLVTWSFLFFLEKIKFFSKNNLTRGEWNVKHINQGAFRKCKRMKKISLGDNRKLRKIHSKVFYDDKKEACNDQAGRPQPEGSRLQGIPGREEELHDQG